MNVSTLTVLLVCVILEFAHAATYQWGWEQFQPRSKRSVRYGTSVVENWNSVCEEVCGAGYGGLGCGAQCDILANSIPRSGTLIALREMCPVLCDNRLGGSNCNCAENIELDKTTVEKTRDLLCSDSCRFRFFQLSGCSVCTVEAKETSIGLDSSSQENRNNSDSTEAETSSEDLTSENYDAVTEEDSTTETETTTEEDTTTDDTTTEITTTTSSTTTTTQPPTTTTRATTQATTTPDWNNVCEQLCRNGDGGSLCNCDIPPFF